MNGDIFVENKEFQNDLLQPMIEQLMGNGIDLTQDYAEMALDYFLDPGILKDIPLVGSVVRAGQVTLMIKNLVMARNYYVFITDLRNDKVTAKRLQKHIDKLQKNPQQLFKELEILLVYIEQYQEAEKARYMANIYRAYLKSSVEGIDWETATVFFEILGRLLPQDIRDLKKMQNIGATKETFSNHAGLLRLSALGLLQYFNGKEEEYGNYKKGLAKITMQGKLFYRIITTSSAI